MRNFQLFFDDLTKESIESGFFTNNGPAVTTSEKKLDTFFKGYTHAIFGSRIAGLGTALHCTKGKTIIEGSVQQDELNNYLSFFKLNAENFEIQKNFSHPISLENLDNITDRKNQYKVVILADKDLINLRQLVARTRPDIFILFSIQSDHFSRREQLSIDFSIVGFKHYSDFLLATQMRSSYGARKFSGNVIATLNGRPSEVAGNLIGKILGSLR